MPRFFPRRRRPGLGVFPLLIILASGCTGSASEQQTYVEKLGDDTLSVEVYTRTRDGFRGDLLIRSPQTQVAHYEATLAPDGTVGRLAVDWHTPETNPTGPPAQGFVVTLEDGHATIVRRGGQNPDTLTVEVPEGTLPVPAKLPIPFAFLEQAVRQARAQQAVQYPVPFLYAGRNAQVTNRTLTLAGDTVALDFFGMPMLAGVDGDGRILWRSGAQTTMKAEGRPAAPVALPTLAADYAARDARGQGLGVASPQATVQASFGGAHLEVVYSRPARRGRQIWGGLVPYDQWWRTGANAATAFTTDRDLEVGGTLVPAGSYTLFSMYTPGTARLIVNKQTGQWGTVYDEAQDLARIPMTRETLDTPVERFTIAIEETDGGGMLRLSWDTLRFSVPIRVR